MNPKVSIIMGSTSDLPIMEQAAKLLDEFEIPFEINALSAHRTPDQAMDFARNAAGRGIGVIIAGAGGAAHLPGVVAALTPLPVIGVPIKASISIDGWDSILSILQMPPLGTVRHAVHAGSLAVSFKLRGVATRGNVGNRRFIEYLVAVELPLVQNHLTKACHISGGHHQARPCQRLL